MMPLSCHSAAQNRDRWHSGREQSLLIVLGMNLSKESFVMDLPLRPKQIFVLVFATILAVLSYWIPAPKDVDVSPSFSTPSLNQKAHV